MGSQAHIISTVRLVSPHESEDEQWRDLKQWCQPCSPPHWFLVVQRGKGYLPRKSGSGLPYSIHRSHWDHRHWPQKDSHLQMSQPWVPSSTPDVTHWDWELVSLWDTDAADEVISTIWGMDEFTRGKGKKACHFSFFLFEVTKLQGSGGNCWSDLFFGRRVAACQRQLHAGSFALHAVSGFRGKLFLSLDHLLL